MNDQIQDEQCDEAAYEDAKADAAERIPSWAGSGSPSGIGRFDFELAAHKSEGKPRVGDLDPGFWLAMGDVMTQGLPKYPNDPDGTPNWWKGGSFRGFCASVERHAMALAKGQDYDRESGLHHAAHLAVDAMFLWSWYQREVGQDDRLS